MLVLHGMARSNYHNTVVAALYEKGLEFRTVEAKPSQQPAWLALSPMGKVPCLETDKGALTETQVILDYLEEIAPQPPLLPTDPFERARVRQLSRTIELYVELPARRCLPSVFFGAELAAVTRDEVATALDRGLAAVARLARFEPWIAGPRFSQADLFWHFSITLANRIAGEVYQRDLTRDFPAAAAHAEAMTARASLQRIAAG